MTPVTVTSTGSGLKLCRIDEARIKKIIKLIYMKLFIIILITLSACQSTLYGNLIRSNMSSYDFTVAQDGSGDYKTIQEVINAIPDCRKSITRIFLKNGTYKEKLVMPESKQNVVFIGEDVNKVVITYDDFSSKKNRFGEEVGTSGSSGFYIYGITVSFYNITFSNTAGAVGQAVAVFVAGDKIKFINCRFLGNQDTLYTFGKQSRQYYLNCYIEGTVDFIFGSSVAVFDSCTIYGKNGGYFTAASTPQGQSYGYVFRHCKITGSSKKESFKLGRPWRPHAKTVFLYCSMDSIVSLKGWDNWGNRENEKTAFYAEYKNTGAGSETSQRENWTKLLSEDESSHYTLKNIFGDWMPESNN